MKCSKCHFDNPEAAKFCIECGNPMEFHCPKCRAITPSTGKFCMDCGHDLIQPSKPISKALSFDEKLDKIQRYLPKGLTEKILAQRDKIEGERKQVTVMFCDMEGFTQLSERLGPEEAYSTMDQVYEILIHKVHDYEGTVNEMTGDGIMALFGAPIALEDAPQRAIRSAMAIHREMAKFSVKIKEETKGIPPLKMRVGIHTGPVVVGTLGNDLRVEFKAVGDTVNLASRMEGLAQPGATYVTEDIFKLTEGFFRFEALGERKVKGKEEPARVYRVIAASTRRTRFDVSAERGLTPFVGREREVEILLDAFERAKVGRGQAISIVSEAGVGKSRLLYEFRKAVANEDATFLEGKCLSYSRGVAYHPVIDILKSNFNVQEGEEDSGIREKVKNGLEVLGADEAGTLPYLLELLSVRDSGIDKIMMSPEARKDRIIGALKRIVLKGSEIRPLILAYEDLHWIDKSSEESLKDLLDSISGARVFLVFTYRPEFVHTWGGRSYHSQLNLNRLSNRESFAMVTHLLGTEEIARDLEELILEKTEGIPFFIEEFVKSLKDLKIIEKRENRYHLAKDILDVTIPSTIQGVIMARVDSLPEGAKEVLQTGSVIEREFSYELIKQVTGLQEQKLLSHLSVLKDSELLYERGIYPHSSYIFKHALAQEVVYDSLLTRRKKTLHEEIGNAIEDLYKENIDENCGVLAEHYIAGENYDKGAEYSRFASKKAAKTGSINDATAQAEKRIVCLERLPQSDNVRKKIIDARTALGLYYIQISYLIEAKEAVDPIIDLALRHGYKKRLSQIYTIIGVYENWVEEDLPEAFKHLEEALDLSQEIGDDVSLFFANLWFGTGLSWNCEFQKGFYCLEKALNINVAANNLWGISGLKSLISYFVYYFQGKVNLSYQTSDEAICIAEESGDIFSKSMAYVSHGTCCYGKGFFEKATEHLLKGADFCERINHFNWNSLAEQVLGEICFEIGEYQESKEHYSKAISLLEHGGVWRSLINLNKIALARTEVMNNERDIDLESLYEYAAANKMKSYDGMTARYISAILLNIDEHHLSEAGDWINKAIEMDKRNGMRWHLGQDYAFYAKLLKRKGNRSKAKENLANAVDIFKECGADGWVERYDEELASLS
jgi:class 3 adenylate cyclase/tetratricopeptide (TPR) repeat protein